MDIIDIDVEITGMCDFWHYGDPRIQDAARHLHARIREEMEEEAGGPDDFCYEMGEEIAMLEEGLPEDAFYSYLPIPSKSPYARLVQDGKLPQRKIEEATIQLLILADIRNHIIPILDSVNVPLSGGEYDL